MQKKNKAAAVASLLLCLPLCGGWTVAAEQTETRYTGGELISTYANETISYKSKEIVEDIATYYNAPFYTATNSMQNGCGAAAGSIAMGYYDRYYDDLIPNWASAYSTGRFKPQDAVYVPALMQDLYTRMKTNVSGGGVTESNFKSGLTSYVVSQGHSVQYISLGGGNSFDYTSFKSAVSNNEITVMFVLPSSFYSIQAGNNQDVIVTSNLTANHIMIAYGYYEIKYTLSSGTRTDKYLRVSTGIDGSTSMLYKVGSYVQATYQIKIG